MKWRNMLAVNGGKLLTLICAAVVAGCAFADRTANREWVGRNFAPSNLVPRVEALENAEPPVETDPVFGAWKEVEFNTDVGGVVDPKLSDLDANLRRDLALPPKWATGNLTNANGVGLVDLKDKTKFLPGGETWVKSSITSGRFNCVAFGNGVFVAGGYDSKGIYYSSDGKTWTQGSITSKTITELCFGGGRFVAAIQNEGLWYSDDNGVNWTQSNITYGNGWPLAYDSGVFVAANSNGSGIFSSTNGTTWAATSVTGGYWFMAAAGNGVYLAAGTQAGQGVQYSTDGQNWTRVAALGTSWGSVCLGYGGGRFVIEQQGGRGAYCSSDGLTWTQTTGYASGSYEQRVLAWGNGRFLNGANYGLDDGELAWKKVGNGRGWRSLAYGNGRFVGATYSSSEGLWYADDPIGHVVPVVQRIRVNGIELTADEDNVVDIPIATLKSALGIE